LNPGVLKEKELAEARAVFEKHGLSVATEQRKRGEKAEGKACKQEKSETKSIAASGKSKHTVGSKRGTDGKFEGITMFGDKSFVRKGQGKGK
jgi:beta-lactam-binding protein with PASTA domain